MFFHLARTLGHSVELCRGNVPDGRHTWNAVRVGRKRLFVDCMLGVVFDDALAAERSYGYQASRHDVARADEQPQLSRTLVGLTSGSG